MEVHILRFPANTHYKTILVLILALAMFGVSCSDETDDTEGPIVSGPISVDGIIFNPRSIAPGDTVQLTAVVTGNSAPGDFVSFSWSVFDGATAVHDSFFVESNRTTVRWVAPPGSQVYDVRVSASNSVSTSGSASNFFVGGLTTFIAAQAGELHLTPSGDAYHLSTPIEPGLFNYNGLHVRLQVAGGSNSAVTNDSRGVGSIYSFSSDLKFETHTSFPSTSSFQANVEVGQLTAPGTITTVAQDAGSPLIPDLFFFSSFSANDSAVAYSAQLTDDVNFPPTNIDTFTILTNDLYTSTDYRATYDHHGNCFYPTFSPDGNWLVYLSDQSGIVEWEYYAIPVSGAVADTSRAAVVKLTNTGGVMGTTSSFPGIGFREWNGSVASPTMAVIDVTSALWMIPVTGGAAKASVNGVVRGIAWSNDGERLVAHTVRALFVVNRAGALQMTNTAIQGDVLSLPSWSPDGNFIVYNVQRLNNSWWELWDIGGVTGLADPIQITGSSSAGSMASYGQVQDLRPVWKTGTLEAYLLFFDQNTPSASVIDLSGLVP